MTRTTTLIMFALAASVWALLMSIPFPEEEGDRGIPPPSEPAWVPSENGWTIACSSWRDEKSFSHDWDGDGFPETLESEFLGAAAQSHHDIVLKDGRTGKDIYRRYAFNGPGFGICSRKGEPSLMFIDSLADLQAVIDAPPDEVPYPASYSGAGTAVALLFSYTRLIAYRGGSYVDVSGEHPELLWHFMSGNVNCIASHGSLGRDEEMTDLFFGLLAYYQVRTGRPGPRDWLYRTCSCTDRMTATDMLAEIERLSDADGNLARFWKLEKRAIMDQSPQR
jgi:hypothetical protein